MHGAGGGECALTFRGEGAFTPAGVIHRAMGPEPTPWTSLLRRARAPAHLLAWAAFACAAGAAQAAETGSGRASTVLVQPLSIVKSQDMDFGTLIPATGGTVVLDPSPTPSCSVTGAVIRSGVCEPAEFVGAGSVNQRVRVRLPPQARMTLANGTGATMQVTAMSVNGTPDLLVTRENVRNFRFRIQHPTGVFFFRVGGTLNVAANQAPGTYTGTFDVDIQYF